MIAVFRADASRRIGSGHVMRCLTLANGLRERGALVGFVCRELDGHLAAAIEERGFEVDLLSGGEPERGDGPHGDWLGVGWRTDAAQAADAIRQRYGKADWLVVDHYALDARWERAMRGAARRIMAVDDLGDRPHDCDMLFDQNVQTPIQDRYDALVPPEARRLIGMHYLLLRPEFGMVVPNPQPRRVLVFFGGTDPSRMTLRLVEQIAVSDLDIRLCVLVGGGNGERDRIEALCRDSGYDFHADVKNVAHIIAGCDMAIAACGFFAYELMALRTPALLTAQSEIQWIVAQALETIGVATAIPADELFKPETLRMAVGRTLSISRHADGFDMISRDGVNNVISEMETVSR